MISFSESSTAASQRLIIHFHRNTPTVSDQKREVQAVVMHCAVLSPPSRQCGSSLTISAYWEVQIRSVQEMVLQQ